MAWHIFGMLRLIPWTQDFFLFSGSEFVCNITEKTVERIFLQFKDMSDITQGIIGLAVSCLNRLFHKLDCFSA